MFPMEEPGFWALTRRADIAYVSQHPELFTSAQGVALESDARRDAAVRIVLPEHGSAAAHRVSAADQFGVHAAQRPPIEEQIHTNAVSIVDDLVGAGDIDFVAAVRRGYRC